MKYMITCSCVSSFLTESSELANLHHSRFSKDMDYGNENNSHQL
jgi:hypothetical protein